MGARLRCGQHRSSRRIPDALEEEKMMTAGTPQSLAAVSIFKHTSDIDGAGVHRVLQRTWH